MQWLCILCTVYCCTVHVCKDWNVWLKRMHITATMKLALKEAYLHKKRKKNLAGNALVNITKLTSLVLRKFSLPSTCTWTKHQCVFIWQTKPLSIFSIIKILSFLSDILNHKNKVCIQTPLDNDVTANEGVLLHCAASTLCCYHTVCCSHTVWTNHIVILPHSVVLSHCVSLPHCGAALSVLPASVSLPGWRQCTLRWMCAHVITQDKYK